MPALSGVQRCQCRPAEGVRPLPLLGFLLHEQIHGVFDRNRAFVQYNALGVVVELAGNWAELIWSEPNAVFVTLLVV